MSDGRPDIQGAAEALAARLPPQLAGLARLAYNYRWSWLPGGPELFRELDPARWELDAGNPVRVLEGASADALARAAQDEQLLRRVADAERQVAEDLGRPARDCGPDVDERRPIAFFCAEYAVHPSLPIYSGGLGALAGDFLKQASDQAVPLVAVGLMYRQGYFRQRIDASGWQHEYWVPTDPGRLPAVLVTGPDGQALTISVAVRDTTVTAQIWRVEVGRVALFLLDSERPENDRVTRWITSRLYVSDPELRLAQYALLGIGGVRALTAIGLHPGLVHLNEGHAALASLELARPALAGAASLEQALRGDRPRTVFTTHTPVPAGNDTYPIEQVARTLGSLAADLGVSLDDLARLGRSHPDERASMISWPPANLRAALSRVAWRAAGRASDAGLSYGCPPTVPTRKERRRCRTTRRHRHRARPRTTGRLLRGEAERVGGRAWSAIAPLPARRRSTTREVVMWMGSASDRSGSSTTTARRRSA